MQELHAQRQLTPGALRRRHQPVREPAGVAVRSREELFSAVRRPRLEPAQRGRIGIDGHGRDRGVHFERARTAARVDEPVDAGDEQVLGLAPASPERLLLERR